MIHVDHENVLHSLSVNQNRARKDTTSKGDLKSHNSGILSLKIEFVPLAIQPFYYDAV